MLKYCLLALLVISTLQQDHYLYPIYPQTAFEGQYWETRFRAKDVDSPNFSFKGLPACFNGDKFGVVSGIPKGIGSYSVSITYSNGNQKYQKDVVITIQPGITSNSIIDSAITSKGSVLAINYPSTLVYSVGASIQFTLQAINGSSPYVWKYNNLPSGLYGDQLGNIKGSFSTDGYYSFNVLCADALGISAQVYLTLNIQPKTTIRTTQLVSVQTKSVALQYDINQVQKEQVDADNQLFDALQVVNKKKAIVESKKQVVAIATLGFNRASQSVESATKVYNQSIIDRDLAQQNLRLAQKSLKATQDNLNLALIEQGNSQSWLTKSRQAVADAQIRFAAAQVALGAAQDKLVEAKDKLRLAEQGLRAATTAQTVAKNEYDLALRALQTAKADLEDAKRRKEIANLELQRFKDALDLVIAARDTAVAGLNEAQHTLQVAAANLAKLLDQLAYIRGLYNDAKTAYGEAQWNYETALNKLYIAQARKQTADRASAIALAQGSYSDHNSGNTSVIVAQKVTFTGCDAASYPPISGTVKITQKLTNGYKIATGHQILYGTCTNQVACNIGETISYSGFLINGIINAKRIQRVLLS